MKEKMENNSTVMPDMLPRIALAGGLICIPYVALGPDWPDAQSNVDSVFVSHFQPSIWFQTSFLKPALGSSRFAPPALLP